MNHASKPSCQKIDNSIFGKTSSRFSRFTCDVYPTKYSS